MRECAASIQNYNITKLRFYNIHKHSKLVHSLKHTIGNFEKSKFANSTKTQLTQMQHIRDLAHVTMLDYSNEHRNHNHAIIIFITISKMHTNRKYRDFTNNEDGRFCNIHKNHNTY